MSNLILSSLLIVLASPLFLIIALVIKWKNTGPVFYSGIRLGLNKKPFLMHKFRTLPMGAREKIGAEYMSYTHCKLAFFFKFLRDTHLDELPQLFNILKGEMVFVGPRPLRPEIYDKFCKKIINFDLRFTVKPGLTGYSQLFTPNGHLKRICALIDNRSIYSKRTFVSRIFLVFLSMFTVLEKTCAMGFYYFWNRIFKIKLFKSYNGERALERVKQRNARLSIYYPLMEDKLEVATGILVDMNEEYLKMKTNTELDGETYLLRLQKNIRRGKKLKYKSALCKGYVSKKFQLNGGLQTYGCVLKYEPLSKLNQYMLDQYFLEKSMVKLFR